MDEASISPPAPGAVERLLERLEYTFRDPSLLELALTHPSIARELGTDPLACNERLEFLGDAVVQLVASEYVYEQLPTRDEGGLTTTRSFVVRGASLYRAAESIGLGAALALSRGANAAGGRKRSSVLASGLEAVMGAVYLDGGWEAARPVVLRVLAQQIDDAVAERRRNAKGELQELTQGRLGEAPVYRTLDVLGPAHERRFRVEVSLGPRILAEGAGVSKKEAEQEAAQQALERLTAELDATSA